MFLTSSLHGKKHETLESLMMQNDNVFHHISVNIYAMHKNSSVVFVEIFKAKKGKLVQKNATCRKRV